MLLNVLKILGVFPAFIPLLIFNVILAMIRERERIFSMIFILLNLFEAKFVACATNSLSHM